MFDLTGGAGQGYIGGSRAVSGVFSPPCSLRGVMEHAERLLAFLWKSARTVCLLNCPCGSIYVGENNQGIKGKSY